VLPAALRTLKVSTEAAPLQPLLPLADPHRPLLWLRRGDGMVGLGEALRLEFTGPQRFTEARAAWRAIAERAEVADEVGVPGSGLIAFGTFAFADSSATTSVLIVPRVVLGRRGDRAWVTRIDGLDGTDAPVPSPRRRGDEYRLAFAPGAMTPDGYRAAVDLALGRIADGEVEKVVLARDIQARLPRFADLRLAIGELTAGYPDCWNFAVDGFLGASPETLVRVASGTVGARVLAGSAPRGADKESDSAIAAALVASEKDRAEHGFAVQSVLDALEPHTAELTANPTPFPLKLPNLWHLASDVTGRLPQGATSLDLLSALHPTAAVAGTPREAALAMIRELEPFDRGRYAGPVGWVSASGDGEWAVGLRSAQLDADGTLTAYAGAGIVAGSDADRELNETRLKMRPIVEAFG
jgi:menaquinone-specific isochorismate synthase